MTRPVRAWTAAEAETAALMRRQGKTCDEIGAVLDRSRRSVRDRLLRDGVLADNNWTAQQDEALRANPNLTTKQLARIVSKLGPARTDRSVRSRLCRLELTESRCGPAAVAVRKAVAYSQGWVSYQGDPEERDAEFARMVLRGWAELQGLKVAA